MICASLALLQIMFAVHRFRSGGDSACGAEGGGLPLRAMLIKSALRDLLSVSYDMKTIQLTGSLRSPPPIRLCRTSPASGDRINRSMLSYRDMALWLSTHSPTTKWGGRWWRQPPKGGNAEMGREVYDSLFFSSNFLFPLEGKCHVVAKGCTGQSNDVILYRYPDRQSAAP